MFNKMLTAMRSGLSVDSITLVECPAAFTAGLGQMLLIHPDGAVEGSLLTPELTAAAVHLVRSTPWQGPRTLTLTSPISCRLFWDRAAKRRKALVLGGGHISKALVPLLAGLGFETTVADDRPDFANPGRFPEAAAVICDNFAAAIDGYTFDEQAAVVIVTRGHRHDLDCLQAILPHPTGYLGMIGSRRRVAAVFESLTASGLPKEYIRSIRAPIGLDIGAQTPAEIALSIAAEILAVFRGKPGTPLSQRGDDNG